VPSPLTTLCAHHINTAPITASQSLNQAAFTASCPLCMAYAEQELDAANGMVEVWQTDRLLKTQLTTAGYKHALERVRRARVRVANMALKQAGSVVVAVQCKAVVRFQERVLVVSSEGEVSRGRLGGGGRGRVIARGLLRSFCGPWA